MKDSQTKGTRPEDILPDNENFASFKGTALRKGTIAAFLANIETLEEGNPQTKDSALNMLQELAPDMIAVRLTQYVVF